MNTRTVPSKHAVADIRAGMSDAALMQKYDLSAKGLQSLFRKLRAANLITAIEFDTRSARKDPAISEEVRPPVEPSVDPGMSIGIESPTCPEPEAEPKPLRVEETTSESEFLEPETFQHIDGQPKWHEQRFAVIVFLIFLFPVGLYFLWKSQRFRLVTKIVLTGCLGGLAAVAILYSRGASDLHISSWHLPKGQKSKQLQLMGDALPPALLIEKQVYGPCDEKNPPFPINRTRKNASAKEVLSTMIQLSVFLHDAAPKQYYDTLRYFIQCEPPEMKRLFSDFFNEECGCRMDPDDMEMMKHIVNDIVQEKVTKAFKSWAQAAVTNLNDKESQDEVQRRSRWLRGKPFMERLRLIDKDTTSCSKAVRESLALVNITLDKAINDYREYATALADRDTRVKRCKEQASNR